MKIIIFSNLKLDLYIKYKDKDNIELQRNGLFFLLDGTEEGSGQALTSLARRNTNGSLFRFAKP